MGNEDEVELVMPAGPSRLARIAAVLVGLLLFGFIAILATSSTDGPTRSSPLISQPAPELTGLAVDGSTFDLTAERGRWVVVNFFATSCIPCIREHPELVAFDEAHKAVGDAAVVSVAFSDSSKNVSEFFVENGGDWAVLAEDTGRHAVSYGVAAVPETYLVAPNGVVTSKFIGGVTQDLLDAEIARMSGVVEAS